MAHHIFHPEDCQVHGCHWLISVQKRHSLHVLSVAVFVEYFVDNLFKVVCVNITEMNHLPSSSRLQTEKVVILVKEQGYAKHWDSMVNGLLNSIGATVSYEDFGLRVAQKVLLWHPVHYQGIVSQSRWPLPYVPPNNLIRKEHNNSNKMNIQ